MQISNSLTLPSLTVSLEQQREHSLHVIQTVPLASQVGKGERVLRSVEDIKQAEQAMNRQHSKHALTQIADDPHKQHAVSSYQSVQGDMERDYVSEVLGIDVYA
ncbi:MAG: hypothetical protein KZQ78_03010 [Candidatus Thiodiazotropha sp. (ex Ustalcina ferruginea)]|nr:hypothetical protein [Candidatus Thiodiazotropha sp. (ex Ustalcina ferruginea)]